MKKPFIFIACVLWLFLPTGWSSPTGDGSHSAQLSDITVYIFLMEDCPISQNYSTTLRSIYNTYQPKGISFKGYFPNAMSSNSSIAAFKKTYNFPFELLKDEGQAMARKLNAKVAPEVVVYNEATHETLYKGRIDDLYFALKRKRNTVGNHDLINALEEIANNQPVSTPITEPVGCFITFL